MLEPQAHKLYDLVKNAPLVAQVRRTTYWNVLRAKITSLTSKKRNCHYTNFQRLPTQLEALAGPVIEYLLDAGQTRPLRIVVLGCSKGAEPYSIASVLRSRHPDLVFDLHASDLDAACIEKAKSGRYTRPEVLKSKMTDEFVRDTFDINGDDYTIKSDIRRRITFDVANALDGKLLDTVGKADILFAQHFLYHLSAKDAARAFENMYGLLNQKAAVFVAGADLDVLQKLTRKYNLAPLDYRIEDIHNEVARHGQGWPYAYWATEPFGTVKKDRQRRYATVFLK